MTDADKCTHMSACSECRAVVAAERDHVEAWKTATLTKLGQVVAENLMLSTHIAKLERENEKLGRAMHADASIAHQQQQHIAELERELCEFHDRVEARLLDGMALLQSFVDRFGDVPEFAPIVGPISAYLIGESGDGEG